MKKLFFIAACFITALSGQAQELENADVVILSKVTLDSLASVETSNETYHFSSSCKGITMSMSGRDPKHVKRQNFDAGLNFKNNGIYTINFPEGVEMYGIQFAGFSYGDNWCYLNEYGVTDGVWEFQDPIGSSVKDNTTIIEKAKYPMDPCVSTQGAPTYHNAGYTFASISFGDEPYTGTFTFQFSGNNQEEALIRVFTTKAAWDEYSEHCKAIDYGGDADGINTLKESYKETGIKYNILGQRIENAKGLFIMNGKKYISK